MNITCFYQKLHLKMLSNAEETQVHGVFCGDLVSWILSHAKPGDALISVNVNENMLAAAKKLGLACVIACHGSPCESLRETADKQGIWLFSSDDPMAALAQKALAALAE